MHQLYFFDEKVQPLFISQISFKNKNSYLKKCFYSEFPDVKSIKNIKKKLTTIVFPFSSSFFSNFHSFPANVSILYPLKTAQNRKFCGVFMWCEMGTSPRNG